MNTLTIYPSFLCPFACSFCMFKDKLSINEYMDIEKLDKFLKDNSSKFSKFIISGGEPMNFPKLYFNLLIDTIKKYNSNIAISSYPFKLENYRDDIEYSFSYDFLARTDAFEVWKNLLRFPKPFDLTVLLTPVLFKYHPNAIIQKLSMLPNLRSVELKPYYKNQSTTWNINNTVCDKFIKMFLTSQLNVQFLNVNKEKLRHLNGKPSRINFDNNELNYNLLPNCNLAIDFFDANNIHSFINIKPEEIENVTSNHPSDIDFYSSDLIQWSNINNV